MKRHEEIDILYVDYLTLITPENRTAPRHEQVAEMSRDFKALARELNIPVVVCSQLRRESEGRLPQISDLRESGSIEQDADVILLLHKEDDRVNVFVAKNRNGQQGSVEFIFNPNYTVFTEVAHD
jgi:replicative DNA helicase